MNRICAPVNAHQRNILQQHFIHGHFFNSPRGEAHNQDAAVPGGTFGGLVDEADGVVDDVDAAGFGRQGFDLVGPVGVGVGDDVVGAEGLCDFEFAGGGCCGDDGGAEGFGDCRMR